MYRIIDGKCSGKTGRLMLIAKETGAAIVCANPYAMKVKAWSYGLTDIDFISYGDLLSHKSEYSKVLIDELEDFMHYALSDTGELMGYTISEEPNEISESENI